MTALRVAEQTEAWGIYGPKISEPRLFNGPEEAMANLVMSPRHWPEDVDFWLALCAKGGQQWEAICYRLDGYKRPVFDTAGILRPRFWPMYDRHWLGVDYWFLVRFFAALQDANYRYVAVHDGEKTKHSSIGSGTVDVLCTHLNIRRTADWQTNFLLVQSPEVLRFFGLELISKPGEKKGWLEAVRYTERYLPGRMFSTRELSGLGVAE